MRASKALRVLAILRNMRPNRSVVNGSGPLSRVALHYIGIADIWRHWLSVRGAIESGPQFALMPETPGVKSHFDMGYTLYSSERDRKLKTRLDEHRRRNMARKTAKDTDDPILGFLEGFAKRMRARHSANVKGQSRAQKGLEEEVETARRRLEEIPEGRWVRAYWRFVLSTGEFLLNRGKRAERRGEEKLRRSAERMQRMKSGLEKEKAEIEMSERLEEVLQDFNLRMSSLENKGSGTETNKQMETLLRYFKARITALKKDGTATKTRKRVEEISQDIEQWLHELRKEGNGNEKSTGKYEWAKQRSRAGLKQRGS
ncbi:uncharacterized protein BDR25DRAFT_98508 [Lindgomyces ingoldianus]|uniref:Uncharacterized protein n=1 Tax=Lindgomyces ingoldianus TaxID=673940 RepID=A0ACB6QBU3_9PLEO|nr:uncharacterized protein BDR25DRAFT_98508 [Lindgomyces ingoldianus]KAF2464366.1 hypothetical protein BDR25DRAFT_98508 [Lindgomyces ingoldianus]